MNKKIKAILISAICVFVAVAILVGVLWYLGRNADPVEVYPVSQLNYGYSGGESESSGYVTADQLQKIYLSDTQTITEILVSEGQIVQKGDPLLRYDTTLSSIELERKEIGVRQAELSLQRAKEELARINAMKPYVPPAPTEPTTEPVTEPPEPVEELPYFMTGDGTQEHPYRYLCEEGTVFDAALFEKLLDGNEAVWIAFEVREGNALQGALLSLWGLQLSRSEETGTLQFALFSPEELPAEEEEESEEPEWIDDSSGYTAAEIAQMRKEIQREIRDLDLAYRMAQVELERMKTEAENGIVSATVAGQVIRVLDTETAAMTGEALVTVSGGGCYYVKATLSEFDLEKYPLGTQVRVMSWENYGTELSGTIEAISDTPTNGYDYYGSTNPNTSFYSATIAVGADADLREGEYVSVYFSAGGTDETALYLPKMYLRSEGNRYYAYRRGADGLLEKCYVEIGDSYYDAVHVLGGLTLEDWIAFPYGKNVKDGAQTVESEEYAYFGYDIYY